MTDEEHFNDEYHFEDSDVLGEEPEQEPESIESKSKEARQWSKNLLSNSVFRNAIFTLILVLLAMFIYKISGHFITSKKTAPSIATVPALKMNKATEIMSSKEFIKPVPIESPPVDTHSELDQKLTVVEQGQDSLRAEVATITNQVTGVNNNVTTVMSKMAELSHMIEQLSETVREQSLVITKLSARNVQKASHHVVHSPAYTTPKYYLQAVIPGRAWLVASNGATLTVREGTLVTGYGVVRYIDAVQGRVMTSSGQVIRFSQDDS